MKHETRPAPSLLLALVALCLVHRFCPAWAAITIRGAADNHGVNPERVSRLATGAIDRWEAVLGALMARGRPRPAPCPDAELALSRALLGIATELLRQSPRVWPALRSLVVGAWLRLHAEYPSLTQQRFCSSLALSTRTLRAWLATPSREVRKTPAPVPPQPPPPRRRRRGRFAFDCVVPGTQLAADTTDIEVCGVPLKLLAAQDIGGRDQDLLNATIVDDHESSDLVVQTLTAAVAGREGMQALVDQGTPYMAARTRDALEALGVEHAPQPEGTPTAKATIERAFLTVKQIAEPVFALTNTAAAHIPALRDTTFARRVARIVLCLILKSYQAGARATRRADCARDGVTRDTLTSVAAKAREQARALENSRRLFLTHINDLYHLGAPAADFIRRFRHYPLQVLRDAERRLRAQLHRDDVRHWPRYFGAIVRNVADEHRADRARRERIAATTARIDQEHRDHAATVAARRRDPVAWLREALDAIATMWQPSDRCLLFGGVGLGTGWLEASMALLRALHPPAAVHDLVSGVLADFCLAQRERISDAGIAAVTAIVRRQLPALPPSTLPSYRNYAMLWSTGRTRRPPAQTALSI